MKKLLKNNIKLIIGIIIGGVIFGSIGVVVATGIAASSVDYTTTANNNVANVEDALNDLYTAAVDVKQQYNTCTGNLSTAQSNYSTCQTSLANLNASAPSVCYNGTCGKLTYKYWNNNFAGYTGANLFDSTHMPAINYASRAALETAYGASNFAGSPVYIRSVLIDGNVVGHESCRWNNNKEFCIGPNYWAGTIGTEDITVGTNTSIKLQRDMQNALSLESTDISRDYNKYYASCGVVGAGGAVYAYMNGAVYSHSSGAGGYCAVAADGSAYCT